MYLILHVDRSAAIRHQFREVLSIIVSGDVQLMGAADAASARFALDAYEIDAAFLELDLPDHGSADLIRAVLARPRARVAVLTAHLETASLVRAAREMGAVHYMSKPIRRKQLETALRAFGAPLRAADPAPSAEAP